MVNKNLSLIDAQLIVDQYVSQFKVGYFSPLSQLARLTEETGELAREINHFYGEKQKKSYEPINSVAEELGDVFIVLIMMANSLNVDLNDTFIKNMEKFNKRDKYRFERKDEKRSD